MVQRAPVDRGEISCGLSLRRTACLILTALRSRLIFLRIRCVRRGVIDVRGIAEIIHRLEGSTTASDDILECIPDNSEDMDGLEDSTESLPVATNED